MKILYAISSFCIGGAEKVFADLAAGLKARGHTVGLMVSADHRDSSAEFSTTPFAAVHPVPWRRWEDGDPAVSRIVQEYDLVHLSLLLAPWRRPLTRAGRPAIHTVHSLFGWAYCYGVVHEEGERVSAMTTVDRQTAAYISDCLPGVNVRYVPNGVKSTPDCHRGLVVPRGSGGSLVVGTVGRISPSAKHHSMFARLAGLVQSVRRAAGEPVPIFRIIGGSRPDERPYEDRLQEIAKLAGGAIEITGYVSPEKVREQFADLDVFLLTSSCEGSPLALLEAMAAGLPCVATAVGGVPEIIPPQGNRGTLVALDDDVGAARAVEQILRFPDLAAGFGANARAYVEREHRVETMVDRYEELYEELA